MLAGLVVGMVDMAGMARWVGMVGGMVVGGGGGGCVVVAVAAAGPTPPHTPAHPNIKHNLVV